MHGFTTVYISRGCSWLKKFIQFIWSIASFDFWINKTHTVNKILTIIIHLFSFFREDELHPESNKVELT